MNDIEIWLQNIKNNKAYYKKAIKKIDHKEVLRLRNEAAERGFEMTPDEVYSYLNVLKDIIFDK